MEDWETIGRIVEQMRPLLAGHPPPIQGAVLADLLAIWLAGHIIPNDQQQTDAMRVRVLKAHLAMVRGLLPVNAAHIHGRDTTHERRH